MATRRAHNKSRLGCHQCKRRRIKCDGKHPTCANCDKKNQTCSFLLLVPTSRLSITSAPPKQSHAQIPSTTPTSESTSTQQTTIPTLSSSPNSLIVFGNEVALASTIPRQTELPSEEQPPLIPDFLLTAQQTPPPPPKPPVYPPSPKIPPYLRFNDVWKDIRDLLPPPLQDILSHYEYTTSLTLLASDDPAKAAWHSSVPELAHSHDFLVNCVLSVASLHLGRLYDSQPADEQRMNAVAAARMNKALTRYRPELERITRENAAALFAGSTLTAVYLFRTSALDIEKLRATIPRGTVVPPAHVVDKMLSCALRTIWGLRGPLTVLLSGWNWVISGKMHAVAARKWWPMSCVPVTQRAVVEDEELAGLEALWMGQTTLGDDNSSDDDRSVHLSQALQFLREAFALVSHLTLPDMYPPMCAVPYSIDDKTIGILTDRGAIFVWATRISREFIQMIERQDRDALVVLAYYAVLPGRVRNVWWLEGLGADLVTAIAMALGRENWALIEWPTRVVGVDLENAFGERKRSLEGVPGDMRMDVI